ncbi:antibiotic biosynthesis monooxygenase [Devosia sp. Root436]|jgi:heme-degrading monooxygenase HmoA|uniref:antibiotic biosynthesis monooxygenase family protein n=1 Tax=Devosia sp. Root436 TaxID=1736537 RepID=UPI0006FAA3BC|nr:antibiotic biosynthesis monooxygenase [Devosia sp. Root436]KQX35275.1 antibiotic biosynthesis monooxygenase [Devosia sp. Root436]
MILEIAQIDIKPGFEAEFEDGVRRATPLFMRATGFQSFQLRKVVERPQRYQLVVRWGSVEDHVVGFGGSKDFLAWRQLVGHCFQDLPYVEHSLEVVGWSKEA